MTFKDLYTLFYAYKEDKVKYTTLKTYRDREKFFKDLDNVKLRDFNIEHFEKWKKQINSYGYTTNHKNHLFKFFKKLLNFTTKWYNFNFTATYNKMTKFTDPTARRKEMSYYTYEDFKKFISYAQDLKTKVIFEILYYCGLRKGELKALTWKDIYFDKRILSVTKQLTQLNNKGKFEFSDTKTKDSKRIVPITKVLLNDLKELHDLDKSTYSNFNGDFLSVMIVDLLLTLLCFISLQNG